MPGATIKDIQPSFCPEDAINFLSNLTKVRAFERGSSNNKG